MPHRPALCAALLLASSCHEERTPEQLAAAYSSAPKDHYEDLSRASQRALKLIFEAENLPEVPGATCKPVETRSDRLRFTCSNAEGQSRSVLLLREEGAWRVAETSRAYRLLRKAPLEIDAYSAAMHGVEIDPEEDLFVRPVARHLVRSVLASEKAREQLAKARPFVERLLARSDVSARERAQLLMGRARLELTAAREAPEGESRELFDRSIADAAEAARLDPSLAPERAHFEKNLWQFQRVSDLQWLAGELRRNREKYLAAAGEEKRQHLIYKRARELADILIRENCRRAEQWRAELASVEGDTIRLRVASGEDFAISLVGGPGERGDPEILDAARGLKAGGCVVFSGDVDPREQSRSEAETVNAPKFLVDFDQLEPCRELTAQR